MFKGVVAGLMLGSAALFAQDKPIVNSKDTPIVQNNTADSIKTEPVMKHTLEDVVVKAKTESPLMNLEEAGFSTIYVADANKILMGKTSGVYAIIPILSKFRITNLDPAYIGLVYKGVPLLIDNSVLHGGLSVMNSQMTELDLNKTAYSAKYSAIGSVMEIFPKDYPRIPTLLLSADFIERNVLFSTNFKLFGMDVRATNAFRNIGVPKPLENIVAELKVLPDIYEFASNTELKDEKKEIELLWRSAFDKGDFYDEKDNIKLKEDARNHFVFARYTHKIADDLKASIKLAHEDNNGFVDYDFMQQSDNLRSYTRNTTVLFDLDNNPFSLGAKMCFLSNGTNDEFKSKQVNDVYAERKFIIEKFLLEPSIRLVNSGSMTRTSYAMRATYYLDNSFLGIGYGHPVNMLVSNSSSAEDALTLDRLGDQTANHYTVFFYMVPEDYIKGAKDYVDDIDISFYAKDFSARNDKGEVKGIDMMLRNDSLKIWDGLAVNYAFKYSIGDAKLNDQGMPGSVKEIFNVDFGLRLSESWFLNTQFTSHSGYLIRNKTKNTVEVAGKANFLSAGVTYHFELFGSRVSASATLFNILRLLGSKDTPVFAQYKIGDKTKELRFPPWGYIRAGIDVIF